VRDTKVVDLTALAGISLVSLDIQGSEVANLEVVARMTTLKRLNIANTPITDLRPLEGLGLERLIFTPQKITEGLDIVRGMPTLRELDIEFENGSLTRSPESFWAAWDAGEIGKK
jgi:Leucine-rich repeat (LRR) protein